MSVRHLLATGLVLLTPAIATAQALPVAVPDLTVYAKTADVVSMVAAATPAPCSAPLPDTLTGSAGTGAPCTPKPDATRPTQIQRVLTTTASDGSFATNWPTPFATTPTVAKADIYAGTPPYICSVTTRTATSVTGKCFQIVPMTLPGTATALLGLVLSPFVNAAGGLTVNIIGGQ